MIVVIAEEFVGEADRAIAGFGDTGADAEALVVARGVEIAAVSVDYDDVAIVGGFHGFVFDAEGAHELDAADFEPDEIVGVVDDAHLVGFGVAHADGGVVEFSHSESPRHWGLRFSRKAARPSLKSGVQRMLAFSRMARWRSASTPAAAAAVSRRLARVRLLGLASMRTAASSRARSIKRSGATISLTR